MRYGSCFILDRHLASIDCEGGSALAVSEEGALGAVPITVYGIVENHAVAEGKGSE